MHRVVLVGLPKQCGHMPALHIRFLISILTSSLLNWTRHTQYTTALCLHCSYFLYTSFVCSYSHREEIVSHNSLHVPRGRELWLTTMITLCFYGTQIPERYIYVSYGSCWTSHGTGKLYGQHFDLLQVIMRSAQSDQNVVSEVCLCRVKSNNYQSHCGIMSFNLHNVYTCVSTLQLS